MTDREKAIVMAYTGVCMLSGDKFKIFHEYIENIMDRPVYTHELADRSVENEIKEKAKADFIALCEEQEPKWIPVSERLPEEYTYTLWCASSEYVRSDYFNGEFWEDAKKLGYEVIAWMPLPKPYESQESEEI